MKHHQHFKWWTGLERSNHVCLPEFFLNNSCQLIKTYIILSYQSDRVLIIYIRLLKYSRMISYKIYLCCVKIKLDILLICMSF